MTRDTSIEAFRQIQAEGLLSSMRFAVYQALYYSGPLTGAELDEKLRGHLGNRGHYHKRLPELRDCGVVSEKGERTCRITGRNVIEWDVTKHLPADTNHARKRSEKDMLKRRIKELESRLDYAVRENKQLRAKLPKSATGQGLLL